MKREDYQTLSAMELGALIAARQIQVREVVAQCLEQIGQDRRLNAWITVDASQALVQADQVQARIDRGETMSPLAGVPIAIKDNISTRNLRTTCASRMLADYVPPFDATVIERIRSAGLILTGKTNLDEFAMGSTAETSWFGPVLNPWNTAHVPGGSSGGSAAAVAAGHVPLALGSDTGGSIRQPCAWCGLTGLKPTYGAVSRYGLIAYASSLDQIGPIARTARDCAALLPLFAGPDPRDSTSVPQEQLPDRFPAAGSATGDTEGEITDAADLSGLRIGLPEPYLAHGLQEDTRLAILAAATHFERMGAIVERCPLALVDEAIPAYYLIATAEASSNLARFDGIQYGFRPDESQIEDITAFYELARTLGFGREVKRRIMLGTFALSSGYYDAWYLKALKIRRLVQDSFAAALQQFDCLLAPVAPSTAPVLGSALMDPLAMYLSDSYTVPANLAGLPALSLPCGFDQAGLPIGMQLIGRAFSDASLLRIGQSYQLTTDHHRSMPPHREVTL